MIEIIYKDESRESKEHSGMFHIPRNVRQIGFCGGKNRIYVEDYVYTFMNRMAEKVNGESGGLAILFGKTEWYEGISYVFIKGAVYMDEQVNAEHISLENDAWKKIQETGEKYFSELDVVGWFLTIPQISMEITELIGKTHLKYFSGGEKIVMLMEPQEKDEAFFYYENGKFVKAPGYYLYYEKNLKMQEYMMEHKWWETSENEKVIPDEAVKSFRKKFLKKEDASEAKTERTSVFSYAATACLVIAIMVTGASFIKNYQQIQTVEEDMEASAVFTVNDQVQSSPTPFAEREEGKNTENVETILSESEKDLERIDTETDEKSANTEVKETGATEIGMGEETGTEENKTDKAAMNKNASDTESDGESESDKTINKKATGEKTADSNSEEKNEDRENDSNTDKDSVSEDGVQEAEGILEKNKENSAPDEQETSGKKVLSTYMVRPGDTLYQISILNYGDMNAIAEICRMNNISEEEMIYPGQIIVLP